MKNVFALFLFGLFLLWGCSSDISAPRYDLEKTIETMLPEDTASLLRNPCMGWGLYDDACDEVQNADRYWEAQDRAARNYASFFYVRWRWSDMEPEEGQYAWLYDDNYKKLIRGARERGLKLCFRIYDNGQDNLRPGTPAFVREAGAEGYFVTGTAGVRHWTPYVDDPVFQEKLTNFVRAFAREYDDPDIVDFVDGYNMGWWGECHHVELKDPSRFEAVFDWITTLYASSFTNVIPVLPFGSQIGYETEKRIAVDGKGYGMRRDGLGSMWFSDAEQRIVREMFGKTLLVGESCWWGAYTDAYRPWESDTRYEIRSWRDAYVLTCKHALDGRFNTLDLREIPETTGWTTLAEDKVWEFIRHGGYRLFPVSMTAPETVSSERPFSIRHTWVNRGTGYLPNNHPKWNYKYKPAFAWLDADDNVCALQVDTAAEPSEWKGDETFSYRCAVSLSGMKPGVYRLAVAVVDVTQESRPALQLATKLPKTAAGWIPVQEMRVIP